MDTLTLGTPMAKKKGRPVSGRNDATAKIDAELLRKAKHIAAYDGMTLAEFLSEALGPIIDKRMRQIAAEMVDKPGAK